MRGWRVRVLVRVVSERLKRVRFCEGSVHVGDGRACVFEGEVCMCFCEGDAQTCESEAHDFVLVMCMFLRVRSYPRGWSVHAFFVQD